MLNSSVSGRRIPGREMGKISFLLLLENITLIQLYFRGVEIKRQVIFYSSIVPFILKRCMLIVTFTIWKIIQSWNTIFPTQVLRMKGWLLVVSCVRNLGYIWKKGLRMPTFTLYLHTDPDHNLTGVSKHLF